jgi:hypothetical protein
MYTQPMFQSQYQYPSSAESRQGLNNSSNRHNHHAIPASSQNDNPAATPASHLRDFDYALMQTSFPAHTAYFGSHLPGNGALTAQDWGDLQEVNRHLMEGGDDEALQIDQNCGIVHPSLLQDGDSNSDDNEPNIVVAGKFRKRVFTQAMKAFAEAVVDRLGTEHWMDSSKSNRMSQLMTYLSRKQRRLLRKGDRDKFDELVNSTVARVGTGWSREERRRASPYETLTCSPTCKTGPVESEVVWRHAVAEAEPNTKGDGAPDDEKVEPDRSGEIGKPRRGRNEEHTPLYRAKRLSHGVYNLELVSLRGILITLLSQVCSSVKLFEHAARKETS